MTKCFIIFLLFVLALPSMAGPTGLIIIPTADVMEPGTYLLELQNDGKSGVPLTGDSYFLNTQYGVVDRVEAGVDFTLSSEPDERMLFNYKYSFPVSDLLIGIGTYNVGNDSKPIHYIVSGRRFGQHSLHLGTQVSSNEFELLLGVHTHIKRLILMADYTSGEENFASAGFEYAFSDKFSVQWGRLFPNSGGGSQGTLHVAFSGNF